MGATFFTSSDSVGTGNVQQAPSTLANIKLLPFLMTSQVIMVSSVIDDSRIMSWVDPSTLSTADTHIGNTDLTQLQTESFSSMATT